MARLQWTKGDAGQDGDDKVCVLIDRTGSRTLQAFGVVVETVGGLSDNALLLQEA